MKARPEARTTTPRPHYHLAWDRFTLELGARTAIMGIVNVTPDSFSDGGRFLDTNAAIEHCRRLAADSADILDIGGESTRPGAPVVLAGEEIRRVVPVLEAVAPELDIPISIDTSKTAVARAALDAGAAMINDVTAGADEGMLELAAERGVPIVLMHMKGTPRTMQQDPHYGDVALEVGRFLVARRHAAVEAGVASPRVIIDPGIGFGKTRAHNLDLIDRLAELVALGQPVLVGPSRKSFIGATLRVEVGERLIGTATAVAACVLGGAHIVRVHDVAEMRQVCDIVDAMRGTGAEGRDA
jgi:dihydropteroate synthase